MLINDFLKKKRKNNVYTKKVVGKSEQYKEKVKTNPSNDINLVNESKAFVTNWFESDRVKKMRDKFDIASQRKEVVKKTNSFPLAAFKNKSKVEDNQRLVKDILKVGEVDKENISSTKGRLNNPFVRGVNINNKVGLAKPELNKKEQKGNLVHELMHNFGDISPKGYKYNSKDKDINDSKLLESRNKTYEKFGSDELYPRIMGFRAENNISPKDSLTKETFKKLPNRKAQGLESTLGESEVIRLLNILPK